MLRIISGLVFAFTTFSFVWSQSDRPWLKYMPPQYLNDPNREYYENYYRNYYMQNTDQIHGQAPDRKNIYDLHKQG